MYEEIHRTADRLPINYFQGNQVIILLVEFERHVSIIAKNTMRRRKRKRKRRREAVPYKKRNHHLATLVEHFTSVCVAYFLAYSKIIQIVGISIFSSCLGENCHICLYCVERYIKWIRT